MDLGYWLLILAGVIVVITLLRKQRICPKCKKPLPKFRTPTNWRQLVWGGWTCQHCETESNRMGGFVKK